MVDFIGIGAQRSGTSWVYACLYEHPEICIPIKEIHFFSRPRYENGTLWYEEHFATCGAGKRCGEFSTSYLYSDVTAERIHKHYPEVKILAILRNPITRALSQYGNAIKGGEIPESMTFTEYYTTEKSVLEQGLYAKQLSSYYKYFDPSHILTLIYEDNKKDPEAFIKNIYAFLGVSTDFVPSMLHESINVTRVPKILPLKNTCIIFLNFCAEVDSITLCTLYDVQDFPTWCAVSTQNLRKRKRNQSLTEPHSSHISAKIQQSFLVCLGATSSPNGDFLSNIYQ